MEIAGYGVADAEHRAEKELRERWPEAELEILQIRRPEGRRIVEEFTMTYRVRAVLRVDTDGEEEARRTAFREARGRLAGSRYERTAWEEGTVEAAD